MKKELIVISDLWGRNQSDWLKHFSQYLSGEYKIKFYDSCELGDIDITQYDQNIIHKQFINFGIQNAVNKLIEIEKEPRVYIGCSVGGVIAWKAGLVGLKIQKLIAISSTRLRMEKEKPGCPIQMYFGEFDKFKPDFEWLKAMNCNYEIIKEGNHDIYKDELIVARILGNLI